MRISTYETVADVPESWVWWWADFQSGSRVLKKVFWTFSYLYLWLWQRGVESEQGQVTAAKSWPLFRERKKYLRRCYEKLIGHNFDARAKSSWEDVRNVYKEDFALRSKLWTNNFSLHRPTFAGNSCSSGISQLRAGKTRSKRSSTPPFTCIFWILSA